MWWGKTNKPVLKLIEPWGGLFGDWRLARLIGDQKESQFLLEVLAKTHVDHGFLQELVAPKPGHLRPTLLESKRLPLFGEERLVEVNGKTTQLLAALPAEAMSLSVPEADQQEAEQVMSHGYLALYLGVKPAHQAKNAGPYRYVATAVFEGQFSKKAWSKDARYLSVLPPSLIAHWVETAQGAAPRGVYEAAELVQAAPAKSEKLLDRAEVIGSASLRDKYQLISLYERQHSCQFYSQLTEDRTLPFEMK